MGPSNIVTLAQTGHEHYTAGVEKTILRYPNVHSHQSSGKPKTMLTKRGNRDTLMVSGVGGWEQAPGRWH